jgi:mercuric ion binding protein
MNKAFLAVGVLGVTGALSICDLCIPASERSAGSLVSVAHTAPVAASATPAIAPAVEPKNVTLRVEGMTCGGCAIGVRKVLTRLEGVRKAEVSYEKRRAIVTYDPAKVTVQQMIAAIKTLGYKATVVTA